MAVGIGPARAIDVQRAPGQQGMGSDTLPLEGSVNLAGGVASAEMDALTNAFISSSSGTPTAEQQRGLKSIHATVPKVDDSGVEDLSSIMGKLYSEKDFNKLLPIIQEVINYYKSSSKEGESDIRAKQIDLLARSKDLANYVNHYGGIDDVRISITKELVRTERVLDSSTTFQIGSIVKYKGQEYRVEGFEKKDGATTITYNKKEEECEVGTIILEFAGDNIMVKFNGTEVPHESILVTNPMGFKEGDYDLVYDGTVNQMIGDENVSTGLSRVCALKIQCCEGPMDSHEKTIVVIDLSRGGFLEGVFEFHTIPQTEFSTINENALFYLKKKGFLSEIKGDTSNGDQPHWRLGPHLHFQEIYNDAKLLGNSELIKAIKEIHSRIKLYLEKMNAQRLEEKKQGKPKKNNVAELGGQIVQVNILGNITMARRLNKNLPNRHLFKGFDIKDINSNVKDRNRSSEAVTLLNNASLT